MAICEYKVTCQYDADHMNYELNVYERPVRGGVAGEWHHVTHATAFTLESHYDPRVRFRMILRDLAG